ncbi:glucokinase [Streptomyces sp. PvR006]|uniref:ROK family protein n=1 Tax=Streptomyces sp. PvR006 TaxID=2817860 RepID=UPI001AE3D865|nr:ROK family protein [Streptomyces sp. PvR006]MBP2586969.1 glucokinase [Streptomyces sp. PvR006]
MRHVIALDVGDSGMTAALVAPDGAALHEERRSLVRGLGPDGVVESVLRFAEDLRAHGLERFGTTAEAAGVAVPGPMSAEQSGPAGHSADLVRSDVPMRKRLRDGLGGMPVAVASRVRAAGLAEGRLGAGRGAGRFLLVTLGTTVDGVIGFDDGIETGAQGHAGRIGHVVVRPGGPPCGCGRRGCLEAVVSTAAVGRAWSEVGGVSGVSGAVDSADCARAAAAGDEAAGRVWRAAIDALADGLIAAHTVLDLRTLILGGGLSEVGETLFTPLRAAVDARLTFQRRPTVVPAALGDSASCRGAELLARDLLIRAAAPRRPTSGAAEACRPPDREA